MPFTHIFLIGLGIGDIQDYPTTIPLSPNSTSEILSDGEPRTTKIEGIFFQNISNYKCTWKERSKMFSLWWTKITLMEWVLPKCRDLKIFCSPLACHLKFVEQMKKMLFNDGPMFDDIVSFSKCI